VGEKGTKWSRGKLSNLSRNADGKRVGPYRQRGGPVAASVQGQVKETLRRKHEGRQEEAGGKPGNIGKNR